MRLAETIGRWVGKVEIVLAGADEDLRAGEDALAAGDPMRARAAAKRVLWRAPDSPLGLALLADACEAAELDAELAITLEELSKRAAQRAEVWVRLGRARRATLAPLDQVRDAFVRGLAVAEAGSEARRDALLELADLDLAQGDGARADLWLRRAASDKAPDVAVRRAEARLSLGDAAGAKRLLDGIELGAADGRAALALGRALAMLGDAGAFVPLLRAMVLDTPGASETLSSTVAWVKADDATRERVRAVVEAQGESHLARWRAAFARASGDRASARTALREAVRAGDVPAARALLDAAFDDRDQDALSAALAVLPHDAAFADAQSLLEAARTAPAEPLRALDIVRRVAAPRAQPWAEAIADEVARAWIPPSGAPAEWPALLDRLDAHARALADLETIQRLAEISRERARPVRVAIVGEFNAGKSTFINALVGQEVAPMGVLPTTATLHHLRYAPDPIARIQFPPGVDPPERIVPVADLRATLKSLEPQTLRRVEILLPIASLTRVEILDTPGFNAPNTEHTKAARAAFEEADAAIWLLDAAQPMKQTERVVLEEARAAGIPVQMLVNKADRLAPEQLASVMALIGEALDEAKLASWSAPLALSARKALAGKLGDAAALEASGWNEVQALLDAQIVGRSEELKERALRRRAAHTVERLFARAGHLADDERSAADKERARAARVSEVAAKVEEGADEAAAKLAESLAPHAEAWRGDLEVLVTGRDPDAAAKDRMLARYRVDRAIERLAGPLTHALAALSQNVLAPAEIAPISRALVRAAAACAPRKAYESAMEPLARSAVAALVDHLFARAAPSSSTPHGTGLLRELGALRKALA